MKKLGLIILIVIVAASIYAGGSQEQEKVTTIRVWKGPHSEDDGAVFADVIAEFEAANPGVVVEYTPTPWGTIVEKYTTAFASGNPPDLFYGFTGGYVDGVIDQCYDFKNIFSPEEYKKITKGVADSLFIETTYNGKTISVPWVTSGAALAYNKKMLADAGFSKAPETLEEQLQIAKALTKDLDGDGITDQYGYGLLSYDTAEAKPEFFLYAFGATLFNTDMSDLGYNNSKGLEAFKYIDKLWNKDKSAIPVGLYPGTTMTDAFFDGKFAMWVTHSQITNHLEGYPDFELGVAILPQGPGTNLADGRGTYAGSGFWCIPEGTENLELVKEFVKLLYEPKYQETISKSFGFIPSNTSIDFEMDTFTAAFAEAALNYGVPYQFGIRVNEVKESVWRAMQALQSGAVGPEDAWKQAVQEGKAALK